MPGTLYSQQMYIVWAATVSDHSMEIVCIVMQKEMPTVVVDGWISGRKNKNLLSLTRARSVLFNCSQKCSFQFPLLLLFFCTTNSVIHSIGKCLLLHSIAKSMQYHSLITTKIWTSLIIKVITKFK